MALTRLGPNQSINLATNTTGNLNLTSQVTGTLPTGNGGTGATSFAPGKVLQVQYDNKASTTSTSNKASSGSFADVMSVNITPSASSSTIAITAMINTGADDLGDGACILRCLRDSTQIAGGTASGSRISTTSGRGNENQGSNSNLMSTIVWMDSPNTTSQVTYKIQFACRGSAGSLSAHVGRTGTDSNTNETQRTSCHLRLEEIGA